MEITAAVLNSLGTELSIEPVVLDDPCPDEVPLIQSLVLGLTVKNIIEGDTDTFIPRLMELYLEGRFPFDKLVITLPFEKINDGIAAQLRGEATKVVLLVEPANAEAAQS